MDSEPGDAQGIDAQSIDAASPPPATSCIGLAPTCGASENDNCCTSLDVPGGTYFRSYDLLGDPASGDTTAPATVSSFRLDKYEVTVRRFRVFVEAGLGTQANHPATNAGAHANIPGSGWQASWNPSLPANKAALVAALKCKTLGGNPGDAYQTWTDVAGANEDRPMNCVSWLEAAAFCAWDGGYLPTEAEWNFAAAGGDQQRVYPWSNPARAATIDPSYASYGDQVDCFGDGMPGCAVTDLVVVGTKPNGDGRWGQSDLAGNVSEWMLDLDASYLTPCTDCANLTVGSSRRARGGNWESRAPVLRTTSRGLLVNAPTDHDLNNGVRCARSAP